MKRLILSLALVLAMVGVAWSGTIAPTVTSTPDTKIGQSQTVSWAHLVAANASGDAADMRKFRFIEVQIKGTWNTGTLTVQGSHDGTNYLTLRALNTGTAISYAADPTTLIVVMECPSYIKPVLAGAGTDDVTVTVIGRN